MRKLFLLVIAVVTVPVFAAPGPSSTSASDSVVVAGNVLPWMQINNTDWMNTIQLEVTAPANPADTWRIHSTSLVPGDTVSATGNFKVYNNIAVNLTSAYSGVDWVSALAPSPNWIYGLVDAGTAVTSTVGGVVPWHQLNGAAGGTLTVTIAP